MTDYTKQWAAKATEMIEYLTKQELEWLIVNPTDINDVAIFFASGGFFNLNSRELQKIYNLRGPKND